MRCYYKMSQGFPGDSMVKNPPTNAGDAKDSGLIPGSGRSLRVSPVFLPVKFHGQRSLLGYKPWGQKESDPTEHTCTERNISDWTAHSRNLLLIVMEARSDSQESSPTPQFKSINSLVLNFLYSPTSYMATGKTIALTRRAFVDKVMSLLFNMLSRLVITFLPGSVF